MSTGGGVPAVPGRRGFVVAESEVIDLTKTPISYLSMLHRVPLIDGSVIPRTIDPSPYSTIEIAVPALDRGGTIRLEFHDAAKCPDGTPFVPGCVARAFLER